MLPLSISFLTPATTPRKLWSYVLFFAQQFTLTVRCLATLAAAPAQAGQKVQVGSAVGGGDWGGRVAYVEKERRAMLTVSEPRPKISPRRPRPRARRLLRCAFCQ